MPLNDVESLLSAAKNGDAGSVLECIKNGVRINCLDADGKTPLYFVVSNQDLNLAKTLVTAGADVNLGSSDGSPLHAACLLGNFGLVKYLVENKADVNAQGELGRTPLHNACSNRSLEIVTYLVEKGAKVDAAMLNGIQPLHIACAESSDEIAMFLIQNGADVNAKNGNMKTPLHISAGKNNLGFVMQLLMNGAKNTEFDIWGRKPSECGNRMIGEVIEKHTPGKVYDLANDD